MRKLVAAAAAAFLCAAAAGCTGDEDPARETPSTSATSPDGPGPATLRFSVYGEEELVAAYSEVAEAFMRRNPAITVEVEDSPDVAAASTDLEREFAEGTPPDVFLVGHDRLPALVAQDRVRPVDVLLEERDVDFGDGYQRDGLAAFSAESALQCMPHDVSPLVVYYNTDLLDPASLVDVEEDDPPTAREGWTWEQFAVAARQVARGRAAGVYIEPGLETLAPFVWSAGGDLVDDLAEPTSLSLSEAEAEEALAEVLTLVRDPDVTPPREQILRESAVSRFEQGRLGMLLGTRELTPDLREAAGLDFDVWPLPALGGFRTISSTTGYCIASGSEHVQAAADFIAFAVGREGARITSSSGYVVPANVEVANSPAFTQPGRQPENAFVFTEGLRGSSETPFVPEWPQVVRETRPLFQRMFYAPVIDLEVLLARIDLRSQAILAPDVEPEED